MKKNILIIILIFTTGFCSNENKSSETDIKQKINTLGWSDSPWISRDGNRMYFMYSRYNFFPVFTEPIGPPRLEGPDRPFHHNNDINPYWDSDIYVATKQTDDSWSEPVNLALNDDYGDCCHIFVNNHSRIYYTKESGGSTNICYRDLDESGNPLGDFQEVPGINSDTNEDNPHLNEAGTLMWFTSSRAGGVGGRDIWYSAYSESESAWSAPANVAGLNTTGDEDQFWVGETSNNIYFNRDEQIWHAVWDEDSENFVDIQKLQLGDLIFTGEASMPDDESVLYFAVGDVETQRIKIYKADRIGDSYTNFSTPVPLD